MTECNPNRRAVLAAALVTVAFAATAALVRAPAGDSAAPACGTAPHAAAIDPDGIIARLPTSARRAYDGYATPVRSSPWASWTPRHGPPYKVGIAWGPLSTTFQVTTTKLLRRSLAHNRQIGKVVFLSLPNNDSAPQQVQQYQSLLRQGVDLIISQPLAVEALAPLTDTAGKTGVPTVSVLGTIPSRYAVNLNPNNFLNGARTAAHLAGRILHGHGNVVINHTVPGLTLDAETVSGFKAALARCPNVKVVGETNGYFSPAATRSALLQLLATHHEQIDGVLDVATMAPAVIGAFEQAGRRMPAVTDIGAQKASLAYWAANRASYHGVGVGTGPSAFASALYRVTMRMLEGQGVRATDLVTPESLITDANLASWVEPGWTSETPGTAEGRCCYAWTEAFLKPLFSHFGPIAG